MNNLIQPFNNRIEYGLRALVILQAMYPSRCDLNYLSCLDYLVVHSGDFNNYLKSLHAPVPNRKNEIYIRRNLIEEGLKLLSLYCLVRPVYLPDGIYYEITDEGEPFLDSLSEEYTSQVRLRASWAVDEFEGLDATMLRKKIGSALESKDSDIAFHMDFL